MRDQPYSVSYDFLERIFNLFYIMIKRNQADVLVMLFLEISDYYLCSRHFGAYSWLYAMDVQRL